MYALMGRILEMFPMCAMCNEEGEGGGENMTAECLRTMWMNPKCKILLKQEGQYVSGVLYI